MRSNEKQPTPAQTAFLQFIAAHDPDDLYHSLSATLSLSLGNFVRHYTDDDKRSAPTESTLEHWLSLLGLLEQLHALATERLKA